MKNLALERERLVIKGYMTITDIRTFVPCGYVKAKKLWQEIEDAVKAEGKTLGMFGIQTKRVLKHLSITEAEILKYAELERRIKKDAPTTK